MIAGRYRLERQIGRGGSGTVYLAHDEVLGRPVAIKRIGLVPGSDDVELERAEREGRLAAAISHAHVVAVFDLVDEEDVRWLVMEYVDGETLAAHVRTNGPLEATEAARLLAQTADALVEAHERGIVHRDVKPSNIMIAAGQAKLNDFGIAHHAEDPSLTKTGLVTGSPAYLAPEVASGSPATPASDVWSLGATLYHAVIGTPPYDVGDNVISALYKVVHEEPPRLPADHPMAGLLRVMLHRDPAARWAMPRVRDELARIARGEMSRPIIPAPLPHQAAAERTGAFVAASSETRSRGRRWGLIAAGVVLAVGAVLTAYAMAGRESSDVRASSETPSSTGSASTSETPTTTPGMTAADTRAQMDAFITSYLGTVTSDPRTAFAQLTPEFQRASGGYQGYMGWWGTVRSARVVEVNSDPATLIVSYTVDYVMKSGNENTELVKLQLERLDDRLLIAGEG